jgi:hypothetical protein
MTSIDAIEVGMASVLRTKSPGYARSAISFSSI